MELTKIHWIGISVGIFILAFSYFAFSFSLFVFMIGVSVIIAVAPFVFSIMREAALEIEKEEMFVEFTRNLFESVRAGIPVSRSIINVKDKSYGVLSKHVKKLANQIYLGIPISLALQNFSRDAKSKTISRAITLIGQAEKSGGDIGEILKAVADAVNTSDKLRKERRAAISTLIIQGYIIFFVFIIIVLVLQFRLIPLIFNLGGGLGLPGTGAQIAVGVDQEQISNAFLFMLLIQGFFSGLIIGELSEQNLKAGVKHSFILMISAFLISSGAKFFIAT